MVHVHYVFGLGLTYMLFVSLQVASLDGDDTNREYDWLLPYKNGHGSIHHHRVVRETQPTYYGNQTYEEYPAHKSTKINNQTTLVSSRPFVYSYDLYWQKEYVSGHYILVGDPASTVSVLEPGTEGGCAGNVRATVRETAQPRKCLVAINAGFFNTTSGACYGDVVSDGRLVQSSGGIQNAHFGIEKDGSIFTGYLPDGADLAESFQQLVGGVIWLVRDGQNYVSISQMAEGDSSQETGSIQYFVDVHSARLAVGHDRDGRVVIVAVDGHTGERGISLPSFADMLIDLGVVNAINLDGGGSTTVVFNDTLVNYPGDRCNISNFLFSCERDVSTVICVHDIPCDPADCSNHGDCFHGHCYCHGYWTGKHCDILACGAKNCSNHGNCTEDGCECYHGYLGPDCAQSCPHGYHGVMCSEPCRCRHGELCDPVDGHCLCQAGYRGYHCELECAYGTYGDQCQGLCDCPDSCTCDPISGHCPATVFPDTWKVGHCLGDKVIVRRDLMTLDPKQYFLQLALLVCMVIIALGSIILNVVLLSLKVVPAPSKEIVISDERQNKRKPPPRVVVRTSDEEYKSPPEPPGKFSSIFSMLPFVRNKQKQSKELWKNWKRKFRRKRRERERELQLQEAQPLVENLEKYESNYRNPVTDGSSSSENSRSKCVRCESENASGNTEMLLDEISLALSSPERLPANGRSSRKIQYNHVDQNPSCLTTESFYGNIGMHNNVFHGREDETIL